MNRSLTIEQAQETPAPENTRSASAAAAVLFTVIAWASAFPLIRIALADVAPLPLAAVRFAIATTMVVAWIAWARPQWPSRADALRFLVCGLVGIAVYNGLLNAGQRTISASAASFIVNTVPILTALFATFLLKERYTRLGWTGTALAFAGVAVIVAALPGGLRFGSGATLVFGAAAAQAAFFVTQKPLVPRYGALASTAYTILAGTLLLAPWLGEGLASLARSGTQTLAAVAALGIVPAALGYAAWSHALGHFGAARASTFLYLVSPVATLVAFVLTGERPGLATLIGGLIAIAGVALVAARGRPR